MSIVADRRHPDHHPDEATLVDYATGALREAAAVLIATHLALCPRCRDAVAGFETLGGALIDELPPSRLSPQSFDAVMARLSDVTPTRPAAPVAPQSAAPTLPRPLRDYAGGDLATLDWRRISPSIDQIDLPLRGATGGYLRLVRARAGTVLPRHTHRGTEMVMVLTGGFRDRGQQFLRGDVAQSDHEVDHGPVVDDHEGCICLSVTEAPLRFTGPFGWIINLFARF